MKRLLEGEGSEFEQNLLGALRLERPSPELEQRMRAAIGLGAIPPSAPTAAPPPVAAPAAKTFGTWGALAAGSIVAAVIVSGGALLGREEAPPVDEAPPPSAVEHAPPSQPSGPEPISASDLPTESEAPAVIDPSTSKGRPRGNANSAAPSSASLREEIRLIDAARLAVKNDDAARAIGILDQYARRFPDGTFKQEARVLRSEALKKR